MVLLPIMLQYMYESTMVSPSTWTRVRLKRPSTARRPSKVNPSDSISVINFSLAILGGARSMNSEDERTTSPGVKIISPP